MMGAMKESKLSQRPKKENQMLLGSKKEYQTSQGSKKESQTSHTNLSYALQKQLNFASPDMKNEENQHYESNLSQFLSPNSNPSEMIKNQKYLAS